MTNKAIKSAREWLNWRIAHDEKLLGKTLEEVDTIRTILTALQDVDVEALGKALKGGYTLENNLILHKAATAVHEAMNAVAAHVSALAGGKEG